jgi:DNA mismatch repair protein MutL
MPKINILPPQIANRIAAGEVIEKPASAVKELVENAIDAGADRIKIEIEEGGKRLIRVTDNGCGMPREDLELAVERHATSKLHDIPDLDAIRTLGFRGEALASIAAVSRFSISSRTGDSAEGWELKTDFGRTKTLSPIGCASGTRIEAADLFMELPARLHFLKSSQAEMGRISHMVRIFAAAHHRIDLELKSRNKTVFRSDLNVAGRLRLSPLFADEISGRMIEARAEASISDILAYIGQPGDAKGVSGGFYFFVNKRPISSRLLWKAVNEAYMGRIMRNCYPVGALFIEIDPVRVDVNVHPAKQEVRFLDQEGIYRMVYNLIKSTLEENESGRHVCIHPNGPAIGPLISGRYEEMPCRKDEGNGFKDIVKNVISDGHASWHDRAHETVDTDGLPSAIEALKGQPEGHDIAGFKIGRIIGQFAGSYILTEARDGLILIDQHAAHEAVLFSRLKKGLAGERHHLAQPLLFPKVLELGPDDMESLQRVIPVLARAGLMVEPFGEAQAVIKAAPEFLVYDSGVHVLEGLIYKAISMSRADVAAVLHEVIAGMACHMAIKANTRLDAQEMDALVKGILEEDVQHCPHGRPVMELFRLADIERRFGRT